MGTLIKIETEKVLKLIALSKIENQIVNVLKQVHIKVKLRTKQVSRSLLGCAPHELQTWILLQ